VKLRAARSDELDRFIEMLEGAAVWMHEHHIEQWIPGSMAAQRQAFESARARGELFVMVDAGRLCGGVVLSQRVDPVWADEPAVGACYLSKLVVAPELRGRQLGDEILAACEEIVRARGLAFVRLDCVASNDPLARYFQQRGYYPRGTATSGGVSLLRHDKRILTPPWSCPEPFIADSHATLMFIERDREILLIRKKRGHGAGKINGPGGMVERGETPLQCAVRETAEEVGIRVHDAAPLAELRFHDTDGARMHGYAFKARLWRGDPIETAEAAPFWCSIKSLPYEAMWEDDVLWLPWVLEERPVIGSFLMRDERLVSHRLEPTSCANLLRLAAQPTA